MQELTPNDCVVWEVPADVPFGKLPTYIKVHLFRYRPSSHSPQYAIMPHAQVAAALMASADQHMWLLNVLRRESLDENGSAMLCTYQHRGDVTGLPSILTPHTKIQRCNGALRQPSQ